MLSAVAARKARLQSKVTSSHPPPPPKPASPSRSPSPEKELAPRPPSKRKFTEHSAQSPQKKKQKKAHNKNLGGKDKRVRYFQADAPKEQEVAVGFEDDAEDSAPSDVSTDATSTNGDVLESVDFAASVSASSASTTARIIPTVKKKRAWSPSAPLRDSSDEGGDDEDAGPSSYGASFPSSTAQADPEPLLVPSIFHPILEQNTFYLTEQEIRALHLPSLQDAQNATVLAFSAAETLALLGTYNLIVLQGSINFAGVTLRASQTSYRVYAPRSAPLPVIECLQSAGESPYVTRLPSGLRDAASHCAALVLLHELHTGVEGLGRVCRTFSGVFSPPLRQSNSSPTLGLRGVHIVSQQSPNTVLLTIPSSWHTALGAALESSPSDSTLERRVYLVKGPKNAGKSTFARMLLNKLSLKYRRVAFLECDLGQSEFTPGGLVALNIIDQPVFGPPFTHSSIPYAAHYIGAVTPRSSPVHYLASIEALLHTYALDVQHATVLEDHDGTELSDDRISDLIPLVVNTMGWIKGLGADLSRKIEEIVEPSDVFEMAAPYATEDTWSTPAPASTHAGPSFHLHPRSHELRIHHLEAVPQSTLANYYNAADHRTIAALSYFHARFPSPPDGQLALHSVTAKSWDTALPLCAQPPYEIDAEAAVDRIVLTGAGMEDVVLAELHRVLNGAVVGLVACEPGTLDAEECPSNTSSPGDLSYVQGGSVPSPSTSKCIGLALIRSLSSSTTKTLLHLLTPLPPQMLSSHRVFVKGELELPIWGMLDFRSTNGKEITGIDRNKVPYLRWGKSEGAGGDRRKVRRNLMRRGQMEAL